MIKTILIMLLTVTVSTLALRSLCRLDQSTHQFPTAYTLLKSSPEIDRKETFALKFIWGMLIIHALLLFTV